MGNHVKLSVSVGIYHHPYSLEVPSTQIVDNQLDKIGDGAGLDPGILVAVGDVSPSRVQINTNIIESSTSEAIRVTGLPGNVVRKLNMVGNICRTDGGTSIIYLRNVTGATVTGNTGEGGTAVTGLLAEDCSYLNATGNTFDVTGTATDGYGIRLIGTGTRNAVKCNTVLLTGTFTNSYGTHLADTITSTSVQANTFPGAITDVVLGAGAGNIQANND